MVFSSMVFLWLFLPITIVGYYILPGKVRNFFLLLASLFFYAWGEPVYIILMLASIVVNWGLGLLMERFEGIKGIILLVDIIFNIGLLGYYKYCDFFIEIVNGIFKTELPLKEIALPIGISFFTFQILSYMVDLYRGQYKAQKNIISLALYISFFPQLIAGPIVKYKDINEQLNQRCLTTEKFALGIKRFCYGLGKKVIIANTLAKVVDDAHALTPDKQAGWVMWVAAFFYTLQIYYDFSGYSDMAIGLGKMFGFDFNENFLLPYTAYSIQDFWRKWHVSLSTWFREYVYIPLGGNRKGRIRTYVNLTVVFFLTGLWHGAGFNFILWGLIHGLFSIVERLGLGKFLEKHKFTGRIYTLFVVNLCWVLFRADNMQTARIILGHMFMPLKYMHSSGFIYSLLSVKLAIIFVLAVLGCGPIQWVGKKLKLDMKWKNSYAELIYCMGIMILCLGLLASNTYNPFIYFRF